MTKPLTQVFKQQRPFAAPLPTKGSDILVIPGTPPDPTEDQLLEGSLDEEFLEVLHAFDQGLDSPSRSPKRRTEQQSPNISPKSPAKRRVAELPFTGSVSLFTADLTKDFSDPQLSKEDEDDTISLVR
jgi:hypothetical protein